MHVSTFPCYLYLISPFSTLTCFLAYLKLSQTSENTWNCWCFFVDFSIRWKNRVLQFQINSLIFPLSSKTVVQGLGNTAALCKVFWTNLSYPYSPISFFVSGSRLSLLTGFLYINSLQTIYVRKFVTLLIKHLTLKFKVQPFLSTFGTNNMQAHKRWSLISWWCYKLILIKISYENTI